MPRLIARTTASVRSLASSFSIDVLDVRFHRIFSDREASATSRFRLPGNQFQDFDLARGEVVLLEALGQLRRHAGRHALLPGVHVASSAR